MDRVLIFKLSYPHKKKKKKKGCHLKLLNHMDINQTYVGLLIWTGHTKNQLQLLTIEAGAHLAHQCVSASPFSILDGAI